MASTDATAIPIKNQAYRVTFPIFDADGDLVTGAAGLDSEYSGDAGAFADCTNEATEIAAASGMYYLDLTAAEMNADTVAIIVKTSTSGAKTTPIVLYPAEATDIIVNVKAISDDTTAPDNLELDYDGTGYAKANSTIGTATAVTNQVTSNMTAISGDATAADNLETACDGGSYNVGGGAIVAASVTGAVGSVTGAVGSVTGNVGGNVVGDVQGNVDGSVASVTGAVGSVTGNVGGNVTGSTGSVVGNVGGNVVGSVASVVATVDSNLIEMGGVAQSATDLKDFADAGYDPATNKVQGVVLVDTTTTNTDMRGTDNAALAATALTNATWTDARAGYLDNLNIGENVAGVSDVATAAVTADAVWDEARAGHVGAGSFGEGVASVQGNVTGSVGSVTGAVGSVTGNVGGDVQGNVDGSVASVTGNVGGNVTGTVASVVGNVGGNVTGSVGSLAAQAKTDVNAEVVDALATDTYAEPGQEAPAATNTLATKIGYLFKAFRNKIVQDATTLEIYNDAGAVVDQKATISDDGTDYTRGEIGSGP